MCLPNAGRRPWLAQEDAEQGAGGIPGGNDLLCDESQIVGPTPGMVTWESL